MLRDHHGHHQLIHYDENNKKKQIRCYVHKQIKTTWKCNTCYPMPVGFCNPNKTNRNCFVDFHNQYFPNHTHYP